MAQWTPMRWPHDWTDPTLLDLLQGSAIDSLLIDSGDELRAVRARAQELGFLQRRDAMIAKGEFPGVRMARGSRATSAGPTGVPWVNTNGWLIRLHKALHPGAEVWVDAPAPTGTRSYLMAVADSAAHGGRWIVSLDDEFAGALRDRQPAALDRWKTLASATMFFAQRQEWSTYTAISGVGVVSDFSGSNEFFSHELLNLLARTGLHSRILPKDRTLDLGSLRALIYPDAEPPAATVRKRILGFVQSGGTLITGPKWGDIPGVPSKGDDHPRFAWRALGKGRIAMAHEPPSDPYEWASDSAVVVSHRYDLVRFWNGGATGSYVAASANRRQTVAHLLFYADRGPDQASVRIAGRYRAANAWTVEGPLEVHTETVPHAIEIHLPQVSQYVALELSDALSSNP